MALVQVSDIYKPVPFDKYFSKPDTHALQLIASGVAVRDPRIDALLAQGGTKFEMPSWGDFATTASQVATDDTTAATPMKVGHEKEVGVKLYRTASWSQAELAAHLSGDDPMGEMMRQIGRYWAYQRQSAILSMLTGVLADNTANDSADYTYDISDDAGGSYSAGVTDFSAEALVDTQALLGDAAAGAFSALFCHSAVYFRMKKNNLIDVRLDSELGEVKKFGDLTVFVDDRMPNPSAGVYHTYLMGRGFLRLGEVPARKPSALLEEPEKGTGAGIETLITRKIWCIHPTGHAWIGTEASGGPPEGTGANQLGAVGSWNRVYADRKKVKFARLISREA
jgi:hypothetical protein